MSESVNKDSGTVVGTVPHAKEKERGITLVRAVNQALAWELEHDPNVLLLGEDIARNGGVFRATEGLVERFGEARIIDAPLAETSIAGISVGMAARGLKPVFESQFMGFILPMIDQILNHAARLRNRTRGRLSCQLVLRAPFGGGIHAPEHHSESTEALFAHIPGIRVVIPSSPRKAHGLLLAAIRDPDPVIFLEPKRIYRAMKEDVPDDGEALPLDTCFVEQEGRDVTIVSWGATMKEVREVSKTSSFSLEIIDVATLGSTFDMQTILASVEKTGRCVIVHEAPLTGGFGAEIAARLADEGLLSLHAPILRVTGYDTIMPYFRLENAFMPDTRRIEEAIQRVMEFQ